MPLISVVVPVYNVETALHYCIDSILSQTFKDFELILIDDGSPDGSGKVCDMYTEKDSRVRVFHNNNSGVSFTRNFGVKAAQGNYICFVDSDDFLQPDYLERLLKIKADHPDCENIWCGLNIVNNYNKDGLKNFVYTQQEEISKSSYKETMTLTEKMLEASPCNKLYNKKIIVDNNLAMDESIALGEDAIFNLQYLDCTNGDILIINEGLYNYVINQRESLVKKYYKDAIHLHLNIYNEFSKYLKKWQVDESENLKNINAMMYRYCFVLENTFNKQNKDSLAKKLRYNSNILKSNDFDYVFNNCTCKLNGVLKFACKHKLSFLVYVYVTLDNLKIRLRRAVRK